MQWMFNGIGTEIISFIIGIFIGGPAGYKFCIYKSKQYQKAKNNAEQKQELNIKVSNSKSNLKQVQKAGNESSQSQIGRINDNE